MYELKVSGMSCEHCVKRVKSLASAVAGVESVQVDLASGKVTVNGDLATKEAVIAAIAEHYDVEA